MTQPDYDSAAATPQFARATTTSAWRSTRPTPTSSTSAARTTANPAGLIRVDATGIADPHALVAYDNDRPDGGLAAGNAPAARDRAVDARRTLDDPVQLRRADVAVR